LSKLNEEIIDTLLTACFWSDEYQVPNIKGADRLQREQRARLDRVLAYFLAQRKVEEYRRELP